MMNVSSSWPFPSVSPGFVSKWCIIISHTNLIIDFFLNFRWTEVHLGGGGHWYPLFRTLVDSAAHEFQIQGGLLIACTILLLVCYDPQSHLWLRGLGIKPGSLACEANTIPLYQPFPANLIIVGIIHVYSAMLS